MTDRELMQMALDALEHGLPTIEDFGDKEQIQIQHKAISALYEALRAALAQPETPYLTGARLFREGKGISFIQTAVRTDADIGEALQGWEDAKTSEEIAQPEQEPVAWWHDMGDVVDLNVSGRGTPLYFSPPQREWQGLTDEERRKVWNAPENLERPMDFARAIEAKLREKNDS